jgi:phosphate transport system protein
MNVHISKQFDQDLENLRSRMMQMGGLVESQIHAAVSGFIDEDAAQLDAAIAADAKVNELEVAIDGELGQIIVRRQPAASDLRLILAVSKIVTDLERIGDEATKVARRAQAIQAEHIATRPSPTTVSRISEIALGMLSRALDAFARLDAAAAARVIHEDAVIDAEFRSIIRELITFMMEDPRTISSALNMVWVAKAFERIGDHAKNIAEQAIYVVKGRDVRHIPRSEMEREALSP